MSGVTDVSIPDQSSDENIPVYWREPPPPLYCLPLLPSSSHRNYSWLIVTNFTERHISSRQYQKVVSHFCKKWHAEILPAKHCVSAHSCFVCTPSARFHQAIKFIARQIVSITIVICIVTSHYNWFAVKINCEIGHGYFKLGTMFLTISICMKHTVSAIVGDALFWHWRDDVLKNNKLLSMTGRSVYM